MSIEQRVEKAFDAAEVDDTTVASYLTELLINWRQADAQLHRTAGYIVLIAVAFELFIQGAVTEISFTYLKITRALPLITVSLPVAAAYLTLNLMVLLGDIIVFSEVHTNLTRVRLPTLHANSMEIPVQPPGGLFPAGRFKLRNKKTFGRAVFAFIRVGFYFVVPASFAIYAYFYLFLQFGVSNLFIWISLLLSSILLLASALLFVSLFQSP
jgi:hypothetical protein